MNRALGRKPPAYDPRTARLARFITTEKLPKLPKTLSLARRVKSWPMYANDRLGDCTIAAAGHCEQLFSVLGDRPEVRVTDADVIGGYSAVTGYTPNDPSTDQGAVELDVLKWWRSTGIAGHKIEAFVAVNPRDALEVKLAMFLFGGIYTGVALPKTAQSQSGTWKVTTTTGDGEPGSWGGHAVPFFNYDSRGLTCVTWGSTKRVTWQFFGTYCDEAWAVLSPELVNARGLDRLGFRIDELRTYLQSVTG